MEAGGEGSVTGEGWGDGGVMEAMCSRNVKEDSVQLQQCAD